MEVLTVTLHPAIDKVVQLSKLTPNEINRVEIRMIYGGGKGNNVARALVRLGVPVTATGFQGGHSGRFISEELGREGIQTAYVFCKSPTRTSILLHEEQTHDTYAIYEPGQEVDAGEVEQLIDKFTSLLDRVSLCLLCGSGQTELLRPLYAQMIEIARQKGVRSLLDSSGPALAAAIQARPDVLKINQHELSEYLGRPFKSFSELVQAICDLQADGIPVVALSLGKDGMVATDGNNVWHAHLYMDKVINVVGCGDSLLAGMAKALLENLPLEEIIRWGVTCGTANTQVEGAGFISLELVSHLLPGVIVNKIS